MWDRRVFTTGLAAALSALDTVGSAASAQAPTAPSSVPAGAKTSRFFKTPDFEFIGQYALGRAYNQGGDVGRTLALFQRIEDGNYESAFQAFKAAGDDARALAESCGARGRRESARQAYLWAQNYYDSAGYFLDGSNDPARLEPTWELNRQCWERGLSFFETAAETIAIPYEATPLRGYYIKGKGTGSRRPVLILNNGSDGSPLDMWTQGGAGAAARGYDLLIFDGPGQGYALWKQKLYFRPDWEKVIAPVVDYLVGRPDVDPERIAIQGISQGGYWVPRAVAFEKRIAAAIADPGVTDVSASWVRTLPPPVRQMIHAGQKDAFDAVIRQQLPQPAANALRFRMRPYGFASYFDAFKATLDYNLDAVVDQITCPMLITAPVNETFWPGQSRQLYERLRSRKALVEFTEADGGDLHCEPMAAGYRDIRVFDWLDDRLQR